MDWLYASIDTFMVETGWGCLISSPRWKGALGESEQYMNLDRGSVDP